MKTQLIFCSGYAAYDQAKYKQIIDIHEDSYAELVIFQLKNSFIWLKLLQSKISEWLP